MNDQTPIRRGGSLIERAADLYGFGRDLNAAAAPVEPVMEPIRPLAPAPEPETVRPAFEAARPAAEKARPAAPRPGRFTPIDRDRLAEQHLIVPDGPVTGLSEEFRIVKRQLLLDARGGNGHVALPHGERILIASAQPNDGKTWVALNLALSLAAEKDNRVLLVDADFAKPSICEALGIADSAGFMDALADPTVDPESYVVGTDIDGLSVLPAGQRTNADTEYLASARTAQVLARLTAADPSRIVIFDSPPVLAASIASVLALHAGQVLLVVRADVTGDNDLSEAVKMLSGCDHIQLLLNGTKFSPTGRNFGSYYGYGQ